MQILIVGAGALGGVVGAYLTRAGTKVTLLEVNPARAQLLSTQGLLITRVGEGEFGTPLHVVTSVEGLSPFDLVFIAVKAYQTEEAVRAVLSVTGPATWFLSMQNGLGNTETLARLVGPERVLCGITYHSIQHAGPGRLQYRAGIKPIQIAPFAGAVTPAIEAIGRMFRAAGLETDVVANIDHVVWQKLLHNAVINPVSALTGLTCRELMADEDLMAFMRDLCAEIVAVMRARGTPVPGEDDPFRPLIGSLTALGKNRPSMWQDLARSTRTEVDAINGAIVAEAARLGLAAPHNLALVRFIHSRERQKFLNRQEIVKRLRLDRAEAPGAAPVAPPHRVRGSLRTLPVPDGGIPASGPPLESTRLLLKALIHDYYLDLERASNDPARPVAACSGLGPVEIVRAFGITPYFPENHAALIGVSRQAGRCLARAAAEGFSQFASSAMRADLGALLEGASPLLAAHGLRQPPRPDLVVYSTNVGHELLRWFEFYGRQYGVPVLGLHPPPALHDLERIDVDAAVHQLLRLTWQLEAKTRRRLDQDRLSEVVDLSHQAAVLWADILALARAVPTPLTFFDTLIHLAPMVLLRGTAGAVDYYRHLRAELEERVARGIAAVPGESWRAYWDGPPLWCALRPVARLFAERSVAIVASTFADVFALTGLDPHNPTESMARTYAAVFGNRSEDYKAAHLAGKFEEYGVDLAVYHDCRTSPEASHVRYGLAGRVERRTGVPSIVIEADSHDLRLFSEDRLARQLADVLERLPEPVGAAGPAIPAGA